MEYRIPASDHRLPGEVLQELAAMMARRGEPWLLIGAAARDLTIVSRVPGLRPVRATYDIDIAVACDSLSDFGELKTVLPQPRGEHTFEVLGVDVDVVPFGGIEQDGIVRFRDGSEFDTVGLREALCVPHQITVEVPDGTEVLVPVVSPESQAVLKILAWRDRAQSKGPHDAVDLHAILEASAMGPYENDAWADELAMQATEGDILCAGPFRFGRLAGETFGATDPQRAYGVVHELIPSAQRARLVADMKGALAEARLKAFAEGFLSIWPMP